MKITNFLWLIALCLFVASCNRNNIPHTENPLSNANNKFAFDFLQQINAIGLFNHIFPQNMFFLIIYKSQKFV